MAASLHSSLLSLVFLRCVILAAARTFMAHDEENLFGFAMQQFHDWRLKEKRVKWESSRIQRKEHIV